MAKQRIFDLPQTKGEFQIRGKVSGKRKPDFFTSKKTSNNTDMNLLKFGVKFDHGQTVYPVLMGTVNKSVYYYNSQTMNTKEVAWDHRGNSPSEGYKLIGVNVGLATIEDEKGNKINDKKMLVEYDAAKYASEHLQDDMPLFVRGNLEFYTYMKDNTPRRGERLTPTQISLCSKDIDFDADDFKALADFKMKIVFENIEKEKNSQGKETGRFIVNALQIGYSNIVNVTFIIENDKLAGQMKRGLRAYHAIEVTGKMRNAMDIAVVSEEDAWGEVNSFGSAGNSIRTEFIITGANPATIDMETYTEENIAVARKAIANKNQVEEKYEGKNKTETVANDSWGESSSVEDDEYDPWA